MRNGGDPDDSPPNRVQSGYPGVDLSRTRAGDDPRRSGPARPMVPGVSRGAAAAEEKSSRFPVTTPALAVVNSAEIKGSPAGPGKPSGTSFRLPPFDASGPPRAARTSEGGVF